jgi:ubiquitin-like modifier-activating enzyme ATG7
MDQQCTVTRPGVSMTASGVAIEMLVNYLQQETYGKVAYFLRGSNGSNFNLEFFETTSFDQCVACSDRVKEQFLNDKTDFLKKILKQPEEILHWTGMDQDEIDEEILVLE